MTNAAKMRRDKRHEFERQYASSLNETPFGKRARVKAAARQILMQVTAGKRAIA